MKIVFMGFQTWGYATLEALLKSHHTVCLTVTHPTSQQEYETIWNDSVKDLAETHSIPVIECKYFNQEHHAYLLKELKPDICVLSDWRTWLSPAIYTIPKFGCINVHDALLPKYGGFAPINWAIINGEEQTGVTVHYIQEDFDLGDIIVQKSVPIGQAETATDIFSKILPLCADLTLEALDLIEQNTVRPIAQERSQATFFHKRVARDSFIDWHQHSIQVYNLIRAQSDPYPNAYTYYRDKKLYIKKGSLPEKVYCGTPGRVFCRLDKGVVVLCGSRIKDTNQGIVIEIVQEAEGDPLQANTYFKYLGDYLGKTSSY